MVYCEGVISNVALYQIFYHMIITIGSKDRLLITDSRRRRCYSAQEEWSFVVNGVEVHIVINDFPGRTGTMHSTALGLIKLYLRNNTNVSMGELVNSYPQTEFDGDEY